MLIGLETIPNGSFKIDMTTFGNIDNNVCYGCAATCALQQLYDVRFTSDNIFKRDRVLDIDMIALAQFENAVDMFRTGNINFTARYFRLPCGFQDTYQWRMKTRNYKEQFPIVRKWLEKNKVILSKNWRT
ncbi:hypothetical protein KAR91_40485, partial [Candidatus Pacearchaeota archaeon]|nr:hypothetical protein [Candidatus Pacearchaeota archaeon]